MLGLVLPLPAAVGRIEGPAGANMGFYPEPSAKLSFAQVRENFVAHGCDNLYSIGWDYLG